MSFGYAVGDVIAVLGLFERVAIELRNYKDAPMHFQQLRAELDLVHSTLKHVLSLEPDCKEELQTLEQIRAIVIHCSLPLQAMINKMRSKESSLDIVRLDDAHGESWALPLQACQTWESFCDLLRCVVYANERPGANYIMQRLFAVSHAKTGRQIGEDTWARFVKPGFHIEQAMAVKRARSLERCPDPTYIGRLAKQVLEYDSRKTCTTCGRWVTTSRAPSPLVVVYGEDYAPNTPSNSSGDIRDVKRKVGPELPSINVANQSESFRRVKVVYPTEPVRDFADAMDRLFEDPDRHEAHAFIGFEELRFAEYHQEKSHAEDSTHHLKIAINLDNTNAEYWYLLGRAYMVLEDYKKSHECFQETVYIQHRDSLDAFARSLRTNAYTYEAWYNLGVLYDSCKNQHDDGTDAFQRCEELKPGLPKVVARLEAYQAYVQDSNEELFRNHLIHEMIETPLQTYYEKADQTQSEEITFNPIRDVGVQGSENSDESSNSI
ncbi:unnamed protein product [Fusarium langsethiae]|nr:unnamed protein product [Fusarium langsethiae]